MLIVIYTILGCLLANGTINLRHLPVNENLASNMLNAIHQDGDSFLSFSEKKKIRFIFSSSSDKINMVFDEDKMGKTIMNLLSNAFKYTPDGGEVSMNISSDHDSLTIKVSDTGKGISDADKPHIFDRFFQASNTDNNIAGTGIGLSLVAEYVKLHQGSVSVADNPGGGSVFTVTMPIIKGDYIEQGTATTDNDRQPAEQPAIDPDKQRILVVDDSPDLLKLISEEFAQDYSVMTAANGNIALQKIRISMPDLIISDLMMPEMDGIELCRRLKSDVATSNIPLIILTAKHP